MCTYLSKTFVESLCVVRRIWDNELRMIRGIKSYDTVGFQNPFTLRKERPKIKVLNRTSRGHQNHRVVFQHWHSFSCRNHVLNIGKRVVLLGIVNHTLAVVKANYLRKEGLQNLYRFARTTANVTCKVKCTEELEERRR